MGDCYSPDSTEWHSSPGRRSACLFSEHGSPIYPSSTSYSSQSRSNETSSYFGGATPVSGATHEYDSTSLNVSAHDSDSHALYAASSVHSSQTGVDYGSASSHLGGVGGWVPNETNNNLNEVSGRSLMLLMERWPQAAPAARLVPYDPSPPTSFDNSIDLSSFIRLVVERDDHLHHRERQQASQMRTMDTCWACRLLHERCDGNESCERCRRIPRLTCDKRVLESFSTFYLPRFRGNVSREERLCTFFRERVCGIFGVETSINLSWGHGPWISCDVRMVIPYDGALQVHDQWLTLEDDDKLYKVEDQVQLLAYSDDKNWRNFDHLNAHLEEYLRGGWLEDFPEFAFPDEPLQRYLMQAVLGYAPQAPNTACRQLLRNACKFVVGMFIITHDLGLMPDNHGTSSFSTSTGWATPVVLLRQMRHTLSFVLDGLVQDTLCELERQLLKRERRLWAPALCTLILLAIALELYQISSLCAAEAEPEEYGRRRDAKRAAVDHILKSDEAFELSIQRFHESFTHRRVAANGLNPLSDVPARSVVEQLDEPTRRFIERVRAELEYEDDLERMAAAVDNYAAEDFAARNSGRLLSKLLLSFRD